MKKKILIFLLVAIAALLVAGVAPVYAHGGVRAGIWIGPVWGPYWGPWWTPPYYSYYYPYYYGPPVMQQQAPAYDYNQPAPQEQPYYWYFCPDAKAYYPYVKQCPGGWQKVIPSPQKRGE
jgi:hypothetical protein